MKADSGLHRLVYEYFEARILCGYYVFGEHLPSISKICRMFCLAPATVRAGLDLMEKKGYVTVEARKVPWVIYKADITEYRKNAARYFVPRKAGIRDVDLSGRLLFEPLWEEGLRRWKEEEWSRLLDNMANPSGESVSMPTEFYIMALKALDNSLLLNLYWESVSYIRFTYLAPQRQPAAHREQDLRGRPREEVMALLKQEMREAYKQSETKLFEFIDQARWEFSLEHEPPVPFRWNVYRQRPQLRYTLVSRILREIMTGIYPVGTYLPSLPVMAQRYGVSLNTVRRSLIILECLGMTRSFHGKGTLVCVEPAELTLDNTEIREGLRLYLESLELMAMTVKQVVFYTLEHVGREAVNTLGRDLSRLQEQQKSYRGFELIFSFIDENCTLDLVRECYGRLRELTAWGYPITRQRLRERELHWEYEQIMDRLGRYLQEGRTEAFSDAARELMEREVKQVHIFLEQEGIRD